MRERRSYGRVKPVMELPYLLADQRRSYQWFLEEGLKKLFTEISPIQSSGREAFLLYFSNVHLGSVHYSEQDCRDKNLTYSAPLRVTSRLMQQDKLIKEDELYLADIPLMTERSTFIINGSENAMVNHLVRSPGIYFTKEDPYPVGDPKGNEYLAQIRPEYGAWLELRLDTRREKLLAVIDRKGKLPATVLLRALGLSTEEIIKRYSFVLNPITPDRLDRFIGYQLTEAVTNGKTILKKGDQLVPEAIPEIVKAKTKRLHLLDHYVQKSLEEDKTHSPEEALQLIYRKLKATDHVSATIMSDYLQRLYFKPEAYNLSRVGRFKVNKKLGLSYDEAETTLHADELFIALDRLLQVVDHPELLDDKDHLANKRIATPGETAYNELRKGLVRVAKITADRLNKYSPEEEQPLRNLITSRLLQGAMNRLFYTGQLSQYLEQINPLTELTHKRRLSALGGGMSRRRSKLEVRDVHPSHYDRICPIETPEGQNIGLITSMATYARINDYGFLEAPYQRVEQGQATGEIKWLMADEEQKYRIAPATTPLDEQGRISVAQVQIRTGQEELRPVPPEEVQFMEVSPTALVGVSAALIPFLEHDDSNRALMGANMQRQAVPLLKPQAPLVGTGMERLAARDSGRLILAQEEGTVSYVDGREIRVLPTKGKREHVYPLIVFNRSNQDTLVHQRPIVNKGQKVRPGDVLADSSCMDQGELALGINVLVAFLPFEGYNYEDAMVISERLVKQDLLDSIHIQEYEVRAEETKLGPEEITQDIPDISKEELRNLDDSGVVRVGTEVHTGDILVGKITPRGESEPTPEERIFRSIFGERTRNAKNTSKTLPPTTEGGKVIAVKKFSRQQGDELEAGVNELVKVFVAQRKKISVGDKLAGRHGNKGVIARILPEEDMPFLPDGTPVDLLLNPLSVPSRMNLGQVFESHLGWLAQLRAELVATPVFDGSAEEQIMSELHQARLEKGLDAGDGDEDPEHQPDGKVSLRDGRTGRLFEHTVTVGNMYLLKLEHIADEKIHARSTGPYSLITQQPLGGKAQFGGQRLGEMEIWALEAYGAASTLQEMLTLKSDDTHGRVKLYKAILKGEPYPEPGIPESFRVLVKELESLGLNFKALDKDGRELDLG
ncbi:MAG TPA: DNA-directed RNA polymerase subunit beta [Candidatus Fraserbacteria bacterium]|nr:DNA-directed RNA polymerase subunit beta [Candidatus Fraserbacteria bacterium]